MLFTFPAWVGSPELFDRGVGGHVNPSVAWCWGNGSAVAGKGGRGPEAGASTAVGDGETCLLGLWVPDVKALGG